MAGRPKSRAKREAERQQAGLPPTPRARPRVGGRDKGVKNKPRGQLLEDIKRELRAVHLLNWPDDWDPVCRMAVLAEKAWLSGDPYLALAALKEVARYTRAPLQSTPPEPTEVEEKQVPISEATRRYRETMRNRVLEHQPQEVIAPDEAHDEDEPKREGQVIEGETQEVP